MRLPNQRPNYSKPSLPYMKYTQQKNSKSSISPDINYDVIPFPNEFSNVIESDCHTLISTTNINKLEPLYDGDEVLPNIFEKTPTSTIHKLYLGDMADNTNHGFNKILNKLQDAPREDELEIHISGHGGYVSECMRLYNLIDSLYRGRCTTYLNFGFSANALAFLMGNERIVYDNSEIMFHSYSTGIYGTRNNIIDQFQHTDKHIQRFNDILLSPYFTEEEIELISIGKEVWMTSVQMLSKNIATGIIINGEYFDKDEYFEKYDENGIIRQDWLGSKEKENSKQKDIYDYQNKIFEEAQKKVEDYIAQKDRIIEVVENIKKPTRRKTTPKKDTKGN